MRRAPLTQLGADDAARLAAQPFGYPARAADRVGFWEYERTAVVGHGRATFDRAVARTLAWDVHRGAGIVVAASSPTISAEPPTVCRILLPVGPLRFRAEARVVAVHDGPDEGGYTYGTLPAHPVQGEETFLVRIADDGAVTLTVRATSRPGAWFARLGRPLVRWLQLRTAARFLAVLRED